MKPKKCKNCLELFTPTQPMQSVCCPFPCAVEWAKKLQAKKKLTEDNKAKKEFNENDRKFLLELAQKTVNTFIRMRDGKYCISCESSGEGRQYQAGHYKSQGGNSALRFDENNLNVQCVYCNMHQSGNLAKYRINLIKKIGIDAVIHLETTKNTKLWTVDELKEIITTYKAKIKQLTL